MRPVVNPELSIAALDIISLEPQRLRNPRPPWENHQRKPTETEPTDNNSVDFVVIHQFDDERVHHSVSRSTMDAATISLLPGSFPVVTEAMIATRAARSLSESRCRDRAALSMPGSAAMRDTRAYAS